MITSFDYKYNYVAVYLFHKARTSPNMRILDIDHDIGNLHLRNYMNVSKTKSKSKYFEFSF